MTEIQIVVSKLMLLSFCFGAVTCWVILSMCRASKDTAAYMDGLKDGQKCGEYVDCDDQESSTHAS